MVLVILLAGTLLLQSSQRQLSAGLAGLAKEQRGRQQFAAASSALNWGGKQTWSPAEKWQCQLEPRWGWRACFRQFSPTQALLRGDSGQGSLALWRWVILEQDSVQLAPQGWLDYCPLRQSEACSPDEN